MNDKILCRKLREAFEHATPDVLPSVLSDCKEQKGAVIVMKKKKNSVFFRVGAIAAALALVIGLGIGFNAYYNNATIQTTISLDVNPSIEISVNRKDKVIEVRPATETARRF